jgi:hypothetical protein
MIRRLFLYAIIDQSRITASAAHPDGSSLLQEGIFLCPGIIRTLGSGHLTTQAGPRRPVA